MDWMLVQLIVWHGVAQAFAHPSWSCVALKFCTCHVSARLWSKTSTCFWLVSFLFMYSVFTHLCFLCVCPYTGHNVSLHFPTSNFQLQFPTGSPFGSRGATAARLRTAPGCRVPFPKRPPPVCPPRSPRSRRDPRSSRHSLWRQMMKLCIMNQGTSRLWRCFMTTKAKRL